MVAAGGVSLVYDGDGNRVQETVAGVVTRYLTGEVNPTGYVQVMAELSGTNQILRGYEWGLQLAAVRDFTVNSGGIFHYYGLDGHGSVRFLTSATGAVTDTYDYDAFGNLIASTGTTVNNYLFAGEQFDPALGILQPCPVVRPETENDLKHYIITRLIKIMMFFTCGVFLR